jgi:hypothetical protein
LHRKNGNFPFTFFDLIHPQFTEKEGIFRGETLDAGVPATMDSAIFHIG